VAIGYTTGSALCGYKLHNCRWPSSRLVFSNFATMFILAVRLFGGYEAKLVGVARLFTPYLNLLLRLRSREH